MPNSFTHFTNTLDIISNTPSRLQTISLLTDYFLNLNKDNLISSCYLLTCSLYPSHYGIELNLGDNSLKTIVSQITGIPTKKLVNCDLSEIVTTKKVSSLKGFIINSNVKEELSCADVLEIFRNIAMLKGKDAMNEKIQVMIKMASGCGKCKYLIRFVEGNMKIGVAMQTILEALARTFVLKGSDQIRSNDDGMDIKNVVTSVKRAYNHCPCFETLIEGLTIHGPMDIHSKIGIKPGIPVKPMLARPCTTLSQAYTRVENTLFSVEYKYDGERAQLHRFKGKHAIFSRNSEDLTKKYPDLINSFINIDIGCELMCGMESCKKDEPENMLNKSKEISEKNKEDSILQANNSEKELKNDISEKNKEDSILQVNNSGKELKNDISEKTTNKSIDLIVKAGLPDYTGDSIITDGKVYKNPENTQIENLINDKAFHTILKDETKKQKLSNLQNENNSKVVDFILDAEVVAFSHDTKKILPFQTLATRKRKDVSLSGIEVDVVVFVFDILYYGKPLIDLPLHERVSILKSKFKETNSFKFATSLLTKDVEMIESLFNDSLLEYEGVMIKNGDSFYRPSVRSLSWTKLKKDYIGMGDSLDLVVLGAYYGKGKRFGKYGGFLMGCYDNENGVYESICKVGTGFSDEALLKYSGLKTLPEKPVNVVAKEIIKPDVWLDIREIWEIRAAGLSKSSVYSAGKGFGIGVSLRFPRFIRERCDKTLGEVTSSSEVVSMLGAVAVEDEDVFN